MSGDRTARFTPQQQAAIQTLNENLLVSAAAGSGKTTVLAERCAHLLCDVPHPCSVDQLLVVTFTEVAAAQMKSRIESAIWQRLERNPQSELLRRQVAQVDRAQVSTLHSFCSNLLRMHFHLLALEPDFTTLGREEAILLRREVVEELFADQYEQDESGDFQRFVDWYGNGNDAPLQQHVLRAHELLCSLVEPAEWLSDSYARLEEAANGRLEESFLGRQLILLLTERLNWLSKQCQESISALGKISDLRALVGYIRELATEVRSWSEALESRGLDALAVRVAAFKAPRKPPLPKTHSHKEIADAAVDLIRAEMGSKGALGAMAQFTSSQWQSGLRSLLPSAKVFLDLVELFGERYRQAKHRQKTVDFADLERFTLQLLRSKDAKGNWVPSAVARQCHQRYLHVLVDEYQDINGLQDEILRLVSRECLPKPSAALPPNLFAVGDVKQSIYRFRLADPQRFLQRDERYRRGQGGRVIDLQENFRSRHPLLAAINSVFAKLMTRSSAMIEYDQTQRLHPGATFPSNGDGATGFIGAPIELHLLDTKSGEADVEDEPLDRTEWEATLIAQRIKELVQGRSHVADGAAMRPIEYRDMAILLRSAVHKADQIAQMLLRHGIPVHSDTRDGFFKSLEICDMISLLQLLDNTQQDIPLAAFLRSPLAGLDHAEDNLARIRLAYLSGEARVPFHQAVFRYAAEQSDGLALKLKDIFARVARWRSAANRQPLADVIWDILDETRYLAFCGAMDRGQQRVANLLEFHRRARDFGSFASQGLYRFLKFLGELQEESDVGQPSTLGEGENAVRIMTIHQSKGLEFPVVFLPDLGKGFNVSDMNSRILLDRSGILGMPAVDERRQVRYPSLGTVLAKLQMRQQIIAEELRVLYVAMTRAREHLIMIGTCTQKEQDSWTTSVGEHRGPLPADTVIDAGCPLQWLVQTNALLRREKVETFTVGQHTIESLSAWSAAKQSGLDFTAWQKDRADLKPLAPPPLAHALAEKIISRLEHLSDDRKFASRRAVISVTEWAKKRTEGAAVGVGTMPIELAEEQITPVEAGAQANALAIPRCIAGKTPLLAVDRGTATHLVLQHADFQSSMPMQQQVKRLIECGLITSEHAKAVDYESVDWFLNTELGEQVRNAKPHDLLREVPFALAWDEPHDEALDRTMLRGRIDLMLRRGNEWIVIDYKTDRVSGEQIDLTVERYRPQVDLYKQAMEKLARVNISAVYLVFLSSRTLRKV